MAEPHSDMPGLRAAVKPLRAGLLALPLCPGQVVGLRLLKDALAAAPVNGARADALIERARGYLK